MSNSWPVAHLGEVARYKKEFVTIDDLVTYKRPRVRLHAQGIVLRDEIPGGLIKTKKQQICRDGEFLVAEIDAKVGGFGIVPGPLDGAIVSSHYFLFDIDESKLDGGFLDHFIRTPKFREQIEAQGSTNYAAIRPGHVLDYKIPFPPIAEQRRIVARIDELAAQISKVRFLRDQAKDDVERLVAAQETNVWPTELLQEAMPLEAVTSFLARGRQAEQGDSDHFLIKTQHVQMNHCITTSLRLAPYAAAKVAPESILREGDILIACSAAGCLGRVARYRDDGRITSTDTHVAVARPNSSLIEPDYLFAYLRGAQGQYQLRSRERGDWKREKISFRLTELNLNDLKRVPVPLPNKDEQRRIVAVLRALETQTDELKHLQCESSTHLNALLPSILDRAFSGEL